MPNKLKHLQIRRVALVDKGANPGAHITLFKREGSDVSEIDKSTLDEAVRAHVEALEKQVQDLSAQVAKLKDDPPPDPVEKAKDADPELAARLEAIEKQAAQDRKDAEAARSEIAKMQAERERELYITKARSLQAFGPADDFGGTLQKIAKAIDPEEFEKLEQKFRSLNEIARQSALFKELGTDGGTDTKSAWEKIEAGARGLIEKADQPLSLPEAVDRFLKTDAGKALYTEYQHETQGGAQ